MTWFVTGTPRSRTAWFAVAGGGLHEPISREGWSAFRESWLANPEVGVSDSFAGMHIVDILAAIAPRTLVIERPQAEVILSMQRYAHGLRLDSFALERALTELTRQLHRVEVLDSPLVKRVSFADLRNPKVMRSCMNHLGLDPPNLGELEHMNIQSSLSWNLRLLAERAA